MNRQTKIVSTNRRVLPRVAGITMLAAALAVSAADTGSRVREDDCVEIHDYVSLGETREFTADDTLWLGAQTHSNSVYRATVTASPGSNLEIWDVIFDSSWCGFVLSRQSGVGTSSDGMIDTEWTAGSSSVIGWTPASPGQGEAFSITVDEVATAPRDVPLIIPAAAHAAGVKSTFFQTDVWLYGAGYTAISAELALAPTGGAPIPGHELTVAAEQTLFLEDVLLSVFGLEGVTGALRVENSNRPYNLRAVSRTYTTGPRGTFGQFIDASRWRDSMSQTEVSVPQTATRTLLHLASSDEYRSNVGFVEVLGLHAALELTLCDVDGVELGRTEIMVPAHSHLQINDVFGSLGAPPADDARMTVRLLNQGRVFCYASVIDNRSGDPIFVPGLASYDASTEMAIPAAASTPGAFGTSWRTDLRVAPRGAGTPVFIEFFPTDGSQGPSESFDIEEGHVLVLDDVVDSLGGSGNGALRLSSDEPIMAASRTYTTSSAGTHGQFIAARRVEPFYSSFGTLVGVEGTNGFRTNVGFFTPSREENARVELRLVSQSKRLLSSRVISLATDQHLQINDIFSSFFTHAQANCRIDYLIEPRTYQPFFAYASVIDNQSGDPVFIPGQRNSYELKPRLELDNIRNAVLIDRLSEAASSEILAPGTYTATVTGSGDLGAPSLRPWALCVYDDPVGNVRASAATIGGNFGEIAGGERVWCVIPDYGSVADNSGSLRVTINDGTGTESARIDLDAHANAVRFETFPESVHVALPWSEALVVVADGDLGASGAVPQVVALFTGSDDGTLQVKTPDQDGLIQAIDHELPLVYAVVDRDDATDNSGVTSFSPGCRTHTIECGGSIRGVLDPSDCLGTPTHPRFTSELVEFEGTAGQVVDITAVWEGDAHGGLALVSPAGNQIALTSEYPEPGTSVIASLELPETGTYQLWPFTYVEVSPDAHFVLQLDCDSVPVGKELAVSSLGRVTGSSPTMACPLLVCCVPT